MHENVNPIVNKDTTNMKYQNDVFDCNSNSNSSLLYLLLFKDADNKVTTDPGVMKAIPSISHFVTCSFSKNFPMATLMIKPIGPITLNVDWFVIDIEII